MNGYTFSLACNSDIPEIAHIYRSLVGTPGCTWEEDYPSRETAEDDIAQGALYILKSGDGIIAVASIGAFDELGHLQWALCNACELARIGVVPRMQKQGIGTIMLRNCNVA